MRYEAGSGLEQVLSKSVAYFVLILAACFVSLSAYVPIVVCRCSLGRYQTILEALKMLTMIAGVESIPEFNQKIGRNTLCPCGSKKKFKQCHGHHSNPPQTNIYAASSKLRAMNPKEQCYAPLDMHHDCTRGTINAHTVSRSASLGAIQRDGHVYSYDLRPEAIQKGGAALTPPLEDQPFTGSREQCFLIAYRTVARELHAKTASAKQAKLRLAYAANRR